MLLKTQNKEFFDVLIKNWWDTEWKEFKVSYIELELIFEKILSCFDDERYILGDGINSLAYFHKNVKCRWEM